MNVRSWLNCLLNSFGRIAHPISPAHCNGFLFSSRCSLYIQQMIWLKCKTCFWALWWPGASGEHTASLKKRLCLWRSISTRSIHTGISTQAHILEKLLYIYCVCSNVVVVMFACADCTVNTNGQKMNSF